MKVHRRLFSEAEGVVPDLVPGGLADDKTNDDFDQEQLIAGTVIEFEHTNNVDLATEISRDHLKEDPDYYKKLKSIEEGLNGELMTSNYSHSVHEAVNELVSIYHDLLKHPFKKKNKILDKVRSSLENLVQADKLIADESGQPSIGEQLRIVKH